MSRQNGNVKRRSRKVPAEKKLSLKDLRQQNEIREEKLRQQLLEAQINLWDEEFIRAYQGIHDYEPGWIPIGVDTKKPVPYDGAESLDQIRTNMRRLAQSNGYAINLLENLVSYVIGEGVVYRFVAQNELEPDPADEELADRCDDALWDFRKAMEWWEREEETVNRAHRDGEVFTRYFFMEDKTTVVRFVEPEDIRTPQEHNNDSDVKYGIRFDEDDAEKAIEYYVFYGEGIHDFETVPAEEIQHLKMNVDRNVPRGLSTLYAIELDLHRSKKLLGNMSVVCAMQASVAALRKHPTNKTDVVKQFTSDRADFEILGSRTRRDRGYERSMDPKVIDLKQGEEYEFPATMIDVSKMVAALQANLRAIAARKQMPEFMVSSDASNANYSSTMVAEGPAVRMFRREQRKILEYFRKIFWRVLGYALGVDDPEKTLTEQVDMISEAPNMVVRNMLEETQRNQILRDQGILSVQTWTAREDLDYENEQANIDEHNERTEERAIAAGLPLPDSSPEGGGPTFGGGDEEEEEEDAVAT